MEIFTPANFLYWAIIAGIITLTTWKLGKPKGLFARQENTRWTIGYFVIFFVGLWFVLFAGWDFVTFAGLFVGVGISGAIKVGFEGARVARLAKKLRQEFEGEYDGTTTGK